MKNKRYLIIFILMILIVLIVLSIFLLNNKSKIVKDNEKFSNEYIQVPKNNVFVYKNIDEIIKIMENGTGVVYLGFPECKWCQSYVKYLNEVALEVGIEKIYYFNILEDRKNNTDEYQKIVSLLSGNLQYDEYGNERIYVPNVSFHIKGKLIGYNFETSLDTNGLDEPSEYWTEDKIINLKEILTNYMEKVNNSLTSCTSCNE